ncbi:hypothetical protein WS87_28235 [Burkholderia sp. MSMB0856]|uniref:hypothetical protein n=1 Tax=Burkholderia sp. MSMB0856 TaxID=1637869 RepID=UPI000755CBBD|nr:hypothetical protein [Burkholderia sp. MSMB0856]AOJ90675.1 hypothetical protein WS87_28235 [Burkholderia sp. MSMB0856]KVH38329.1 hypothetical protein WS87_08755 [Burkholderia sp. MSMB0856]
MRKSTMAAIVVVGGLILIAWGVIASVGAVSQISGGSYGSHDVSDFAIENFLFLGLMIALGGLVAWLASRDSGAPDDDEQMAGNGEGESSASTHRDSHS